MMKNSVPSEVTTTSGGEREKQGNVSSKTVLSGPEEEGTYNRFSCFAVHSKMSQSTNAKSKPTEGLYTDTDPDNRSEIITDVTIRMPGKAGTMMMEVKVDPGVQPSCIPLHKFKTLFPHLCRDGLPKEGLLDNTHNEFQSYCDRIRIRLCVCSGALPSNYLCDLYARPGTPCTSRHRCCQSNSMQFPYKRQSFCHRSALQT